jgi:alpha-L-fucosidase
LSAQDVRFTKKGDVLYAFLMGWPEQETKVAALAVGGEHGVGKIQNVELVGAKGKLEWRQDAAGLTVKMPPDKPSDHAVALRIVGA